MPVFEADDWVLFALSEQYIGLMPSAHAVWVGQALPDCHWQMPAPAPTSQVLANGARVPPGIKLSAALVWRPRDSSPEACTRHMTQLATALRDQGLITGWRDERYSVECPGGDPCLERGPTLFEMERAAFRFFGFMSRAVHLHGEDPGGRVWCGRRSMSKAIDPGLLDNLAAGGVGAGEDLTHCAQRELWEEAGVPEALSQHLQWQAAVRSTRIVPEGLHDEVLHVATLGLPAEFEPRNQDGEVSGFIRLTEEACRLRMARGEFTADAALVTQRVLEGRSGV